MPDPAPVTTAVCLLSWATIVTDYLFNTKVFSVGHRLRNAEYTFNIYCMVGKTHMQRSVSNLRTDVSNTQMTAAGRLIFAALLVLIVPLLPFLGLLWIGDKITAS
ncbi:DUF7535 family protein [Halobacterium jilantaiense]